MGSTKANNPTKMSISEAIRRHYVAANDVCNNPSLFIFKV